MPAARPGESRLPQHPKGRRRQRGRITHRHQQAVHAVGDDEGNSSRRRGHHRQPRRERLEDRIGHVVDIGRVEVQVGFPVEPGHFVGRHRPGEADAAQFQLTHQALELGPPASGSHQGQRRRGDLLLHQGKGPDHAFDIVERLEVAVRQKPGSGVLPDPERNHVEIDEILHALGPEPVTGEDSHQVLRGGDDRVGQPKQRPDMPAPASEMVVGFTAPIVDHHFLPQQPGQQNGGRGRQQEREVARAEGVDHIDPGNAPQQGTEIGDLGDEGPHPSDLLQPAQPSGERGIDRNERDLETGDLAEGVEEPARLNRLSAQLAERRSDQQDPDGLSASRHSILPECRARSRPEWRPAC